MPANPQHLMRDTERIRALRTAFFAVAAVVLTLAFALAAGAHASDKGSRITLEPISLANGTAVVTGSVGRDPDATGTLDVAGQPVGVDASGHFSTVVALDGQSTLVLTLDEGKGGVTTIRIPVTLLQNGAKDVLDELEAAGISLVVPSDGFQIVDGNIPTVSGHVLDRSNLAGLTVNGHDVLGLAGPNGGFSLPLPGGTSSRQATFVATDHRNVSQTTTYPTTTVTSVIKTSSGTSVSAAGAHGVVIARIRFDRKGLLTQRRLGIVVTVKDRRGYLVRGAALHLMGRPVRYLVNGANRAGFTNRVGVGRFAYRLQKQAFTSTFPRRFSLTVRASTPRAAAKKIVRVRLPLLPST